LSAIKFDSFIFAKNAYNQIRLDGTPRVADLSQPDAAMNIPEMCCRMATGIVPRAK
jgi:hypothetical protein